MNVQITQIQYPQEYTIKGIEYNGFEAEMMFKKWQ